MNVWQVGSLAILGLGIAAVIVAIVWVRLASGEEQVVLEFRQIKEAWRAGAYRNLFPVLLGIAGLFVAAFSVALVMFAFQAPLIVSVIWLGASVYAVVQTIRGFARA